MAAGYKEWVQITQGDVSLHTGAQLKKGDLFPKCELTLLNKDADATYLGIANNEKKIKLSDIPAEYLFVEIFNEKCWGCVAEIRHYKNLHSKFADDPELSKNLKIIGIGAGSSNRAVIRFRREQRVPFPLFADSQKKIFKCLGFPALPTAYLIKRVENTERKIVFTQSDHIEDIEPLLTKIVKIVSQKDFN